MTYQEWKKLPGKVEVDCRDGMVAFCPYPYYVEATSYADADRCKAVFVKGLYSGDDYEPEPRTSSKPRE